MWLLSFLPLIVSAVSELRRTDPRRNVALEIAVTVDLHAAARFEFRCALLNGHLQDHWVRLVASPLKL